MCFLKWINAFRGSPLSLGELFCKWSLSLEIWELWDVTQCTVVILYRRFGTICRFHFRSSIMQEERKLNLQVVPKRRYEITILCCVRSHTRADLIYITTEAWNHAWCPLGGDYSTSRLEIRKTSNKISQTPYFPWRRDRNVARNVGTNYHSTLCKIPKERRLEMAF